MGFPSPATDYIEMRIDLNHLMLHPDATFRVDTERGFVLVDRAERVKPGDLIAFQHLGYPAIGKIFKGSIVTVEGETLEGESLEDVIVLGKVTYEVLKVYEEDGPV